MSHAAKLANQDRGDDLDRTEADRGQPTLAPGTPDGPVGHDHGGAPSEPESATQSDPASAPPGRAPTTEDLDPLDPGHLVYVCPDCPTEHTEAINANAHQKRTGHGQWTRENPTGRVVTLPVRSGMEADDAIATVGQACASLGIEVDDAPIEVAS